MDKLIEKPKEVFIARFFSEDEPSKVIVEFDTKEEIDDWYEAQGKWLEEEEGGRIKIDFGQSELATRQEEDG